MRGPPLIKKYGAPRGSSICPTVAPALTAPVVKGGTIWKFMPIFHLSSAYGEEDQVKWTLDLVGVMKPVPLLGPKSTPTPYQFPFHFHFRFRFVVVAPLAVISCNFIITFARKTLTGA